MNAINLYMTCEEFSSIIKSKLSKADQEKFKDCTWIPLKIELNETTFDIETLVVPVKNGNINSCDNDRHNITYFGQNKVEDNGFGFNVYTGKPFIINPATCEHDWRLHKIYPNEALMKDEYLYMCNICGLTKREYKEYEEE